MKKIILIGLFTLMIIIIYRFLDNLRIVTISVDNDVKKFNSAQWKKAGNYDIIRHQMFDDLAKNYLKLNMSKSEIINLLGKPNCQRCGFPQDVKIDTIMCYHVSTGLDVCSLDIYLNNLSKLTSFEICCN